MILRVYYQVNIIQDKEKIKGIIINRRKLKTNFDQYRVFTFEIKNFVQETRNDTKPISVYLDNVAEYLHRNRAICVYICVYIYIFIYFYWLAEISRLCVYRCNFHNVIAVRTACFNYISYSWESFSTFLKQSADFFSRHKICIQLYVTVNDLNNRVCRRYSVP